MNKKDNNNLNEPKEVKTSKLASVKKHLDKNKKSYFLVVLFSALIGIFWKSLKLLFQGIVALGKGIKKGIDGVAVPIGKALPSIGKGIKKGLVWVGDGFGAVLGGLGKALPYLLPTIVILGIGTGIGVGIWKARKKTDNSNPPAIQKKFEPQEIKDNKKAFDEKVKPQLLVVKPILDKLPSKEKLKEIQTNPKSFFKKNNDFKIKFGEMIKKIFDIKEQELPLILQAKIQPKTSLPPKNNAEAIKELLEINDEGYLADGFRLKILGEKLNSQIVRIKKIETTKRTQRIKDIADGLGIKNLNKEFDNTKKTWKQWIDAKLKKGGEFLFGKNFNLQKKIKELNKELKKMATSLLAAFGFLPSFNF